MGKEGDRDVCAVIKHICGPRLSCGTLLVPRTVEEGGEGCYLNTVLVAEGGTQATLFMHTSTEKKPVYISQAMSTAVSLLFPEKMMECILQRV